MYFQLVHLITALAGTSFSADLQLAIADDVQAIALEEPPLMRVKGGSEFDDRTMSACLATVWWYGESAFRPEVVGDKGTSFGVGQMKRPYFDYDFVGVSFDSATKNRRESMRASWRFMRQMIQDCGSVAGGLGKYATGYCGGARDKVKARMQRAASKC